MSKRFVFAVALSFIGIMATTSMVPAQTSVYNTVVSLSPNETILQATALIVKYTDIISKNEAYLTKNAKFSTTASYQKIYVSNQWYIAERQRYITLVANSTAPIQVSESSTFTDSTRVVRGTTVEVSAETSTVEERTENLVKVFEVITRYVETPVTTTVVRVTQTVRNFSNGTRETSISTAILSKTVEIEKTSNTEKTFLREYVVEAPKVFLTSEQYMAQSDVNLSYTQTYTDAFLRRFPTVSVGSITGTFTIYGNSLSSTGAPIAWSRGYTGDGSTISILDTGIDLDHSEFADSIAATKCFTGMCAAGYETVQDKNNFSHGTHVAGIAAAALDGVGTTGVAPDADLLIGKIAYDNGFVEMDKLGAAVSWSVSNGADVINLSAASNVDSTYRSSVSQVGDGLFLSNDIRENYATLGYNNALDASGYVTSFANAMQNNEAVMVIAAGNQGLKYSSFPAHFAVMENPDGTLTFDGRIIVAGNYDIRTGALSTSSNAAGTMCFDYNASSNTCNNEYRVSDFYLMAPGMYVASTGIDGYTVNSGTSMAAPMIAGGVALVHQMWPYMTGENVAKLLLETGNKTFTGYNVNLHGQGIMDLDAATTPQGAIGIPTTGRVEGTTTSISGGSLAIAGASIASFENVMVVDSYNRDFYMNGNNMNVGADTRSVDLPAALAQSVSINEYSAYAGGATVPVGSANVTIAPDGENYAMSFSSGAVTVGMLTEQETFLGNLANSPLMRVQGAKTVYATLAKEYQARNFTAFGNASIGVTDLEIDSTALVKDASVVVSNSFNVGAKFKTKKGEFGLVTALPVAISHGNISVEQAASVSSEGDIASETSESSISNQNRERSIGMFYNTVISQQMNFGMTAEMRDNYLGISGNQDHRIGINFAYSF